MDNQKGSKPIQSVHISEKIKNKYLLENIFSFISKKKLFTIIMYNKEIQNCLNINKNDYENYGKVKIEIIASKNNGIFINIPEEYEFLFHIYFIFFIMLL